jgi:hypothetical protein
MQCNKKSNLRALISVSKQFLSLPLWWFILCIYLANLLWFIYIPDHAHMNCSNFNKFDIINCVQIPRYSSQELEVTQPASLKIRLNVILHHLIGTSSECLPIEILYTYYISHILFICLAHWSVFDFVIMSCISCYVSNVRNSSFFILLKPQNIFLVIFVSKRM